MHTAGVYGCVLIKLEKVQKRTQMREIFEGACVYCNIVKQIRLQRVDVIEKTIHGDITGDSALIVCVCGRCCCFFF